MSKQEHVQFHADPNTIAPPSTRNNTQKLIATTRMRNDDMVRMVIVDFSNSAFHDDENYDQQHTQNLENLLKKKFTLQQAGKKKWLLNRELKYENFFPVEFMNDQEFVLNHIEKFGYGLGYTSPHLTEDRDFMLKAVQLNGGYALGYASESIRNDKQVVLKAINQTNGNALRGVHSAVLQREVALAAVQQNGEALQFVQSTDWIYDKVIIFEAIKQNKKALRWVPAGFLQDPDFMLKALKIIFPEFGALESFDYANKAIMIKVVQEFGLLLEFASNDLKHDRDIILNAVRNDGDALKLATWWSHDKEIALIAVKNNGYALEHVSNDLRRDRNVVLEAVKQNGNALQFASNDLRNDYEIALASVRQDSCALAYVGEMTTRYPEIVLEAIRKNSHAVRYVAKRVLYDKQFLLKLVKLGCNHVLQYAARQFTQDKEFVLQAVKHDGLVVSCYDFVFSSDKEIMLEAVRNNGCALKYASRELRKDPELVWEALKCHGYVLKYSDELFQVRMDHCYYGAYLGKTEQCSPKTKPQSKQVHDDMKMIMVDGCSNDTMNDDSR
ncbi:hypothetical protein C9374_005892 [Naegleria lovaniensis]|uniref:DUF4116 domain-containing protein n=1 Tax=Naegleria lovaniensis TaxID=51637 RepID=A0AA88KJZ8_NAELO|nr:uncharacterized protein C9374_005892 [Naegleria lovaniensis]KAG2382100.1 hypothetical protein C9374_005892 [Naegleria lovaniensis]